MAATAAGCGAATLSEDDTLQPFEGKAVAIGADGSVLVPGVRGSLDDRGCQQSLAVARIGRQRSSGASGGFRNHFRSEASRTATSASKVSWAWLRCSARASSSGLWRHSPTAAPWSSAPSGGTGRVVIARFTAAGRLDRSFGRRGVRRLDVGVEPLSAGAEPEIDLAVAEDGPITGLVGGSFRTPTELAVSLRGRVPER